MTLLAVIPARGGSKGIPQKALQPVAGVPLILRTYRTVKASGVADRIVVSTDCPQIKGFCVLRGIEVIDRPAELATDDIPLAPVIKHAITATDWQGEVAVFQPTCPLLTSDTVKRVVAEFRDRKLSWAITASEDRHLFWTPGGHPLTERVNRQQATDPLLRETGAVQILKTTYVKGGEGVIPIPASEALDIDTPADLTLARQQLEASTIHFYVTMSDRVGSGHYWRCLQLADTLTTRGHRVAWSWTSDSQPAAWATETVRRRGYGRYQAHPADVCVFDVLNASERWVLTCKAQGRRIVMFEDDGPAARHADLYVNEMVDGPEWAVLRPEFTCLPEYEVRDHRDRPGIAVTFGGTDPSGLGERVAYTDHGGRNVHWIQPHMNVHMAQEMQQADLCITGQGRTVYEAAACGVPCLSIAANEREARHVRIPGVIYLGLHTLVSDQQLRETVQRILADRTLREDMSRTARAQIDGRGLDRIVSRIEDLAAGL